VCLSWPLQAAAEAKTISPRDTSSLAAISMLLMGMPQVPQAVNSDKQTEACTSSPDIPYNIICDVE
jgi:hypothetical protein